MGMVVSVVAAACNAAGAALAAGVVSRWAACNGACNGAGDLVTGAAAPVPTATGTADAEALASGLVPLAPSSAAGTGAFKPVREKEAHGSWLPSANTTGNGDGERAFALAATSGNDAVLLIGMAVVAGEAAAGPWAAAMLALAAVATGCAASGASAPGVFLLLAGSPSPTNPNCDHGDRARTSALFLAAAAGNDAAVLTGKLALAAAAAGNAAAAASPAGVVALAGACSGGADKVSLAPGGLALAPLAPSLSLCMGGRAWCCSRQR